VRDETFGRYGAAAQQFQAALAADPNFADARAHLSGIEGRTSLGSATPGRRVSTQSGGRAALVAASG
jgi:hypothetical protein